ncbi:unnamed protein product, partial [marine sediment metagenome]
MYEAVDNNNLIVQTGEGGIIFLSSIGASLALNDEDWYY